ncbi:uncharacterized protein I303_100507 [Kwoniella dejecticola CBS 10117]|uniref:Zn(2)-C6 fungal-type domain-containing protein n=1 Tax=Kwoniella dejecticola CBS 10117 TaxID=1296121 RepID=A0AAJ8KGR7_9TREE
MPRDTTPPADDNNARPAKRTRVFRACQYCVAAKTRCEDVQPSGCFLCRRKGKECSLAGLSGPGPEYTNGHPDGRYGPGSGRGESSSRGIDEEEISLLSDKVNRQERKYRELEMKVLHLEEQLHQQQVQQVQQQQDRQAATAPQQRSPEQCHTCSTALAGGGEGSTPAFSKHFAATAHPLLMQSWHMHSPIFDENLFGATDPNSLPDVVEVGLLNREQLEMGFQLFKHRFSQLYPLSLFLKTSTPTPQQSFINLAMLYHLDLLPAEHLARLIEQSLMAFLSGSVSKESVFGLFILSLSPIKPSLSPRSQPSALRMISLAYNLGNDIGISQTVQMALKDVEGLKEPWSDKTLDLVLLWTAIINRYNILHIISTRCNLPIKSPASLLPIDHPSETVRQTITHLKGEDELVNMVTDHISHLNEIEVDWIPEKFLGCYEDINQLSFLLPFSSSSAQSAIHLRLLSRDSKCVEFALVIRLAVIVQKIPSPLDPSIRSPGLTAIGQNYLNVSTALLDLLSPSYSESSNTSSLPSYIVLCICTALVCVRRAIVYTKRSHPDVHSGEYGRLRQAEKILRSLGGSAGLIVDHTNVQLGPLGDPVSSTFGSDIGAQTDMANNFDWATLDWSSWDWNSLLVDPMTLTMEPPNL